MPEWREVKDGDVLATFTTEPGTKITPWQVSVVDGVTASLRICLFLEEPAARSWAREYAAANDFYSICVKRVDKHG